MAPRVLPLLLLAGLLTGALVPVGWAEEAPLPAVALRCRLDGGPWQDCQMRVERLGERWSLLVGRERVWFEHDGRGRVRMLRGQRTWRPVEARWEADAALCWDGICAQGDIPLD